MKVQNKSSKGKSLKSNSSVEKNGKSQTFVEQDLETGDSESGREEDDEIPISSKTNVSQHKQIFSVVDSDVESENNEVDGNPYTGEVYTDPSEETVAMRNIGWSSKVHRVISDFEVFKIAKFL